MSYMRHFIVGLIVAWSTACLRGNALLIPLPDGGRAEGVAHLRGTNFIASDIFTGNVFLIDVASALVTTVVRAPAGRVGVGLYASGEYIFVAGGGNFSGVSVPITPPLPALHVYKVSSGVSVASCVIQFGGVVNDVVADSSYAYFTDSQRPAVYQLNIRALPLCDVITLTLPPDAFPPNASTSANGIVTFRGGLLVASTALATIFFVDLRAGIRVSPILPVSSLPGVDGLALSGSPIGTLLYVAQNAENKISVWRLSSTTLTSTGGFEEMRVVASKVGAIVRPKQLASPTTVAVSRDYLVAANFNFSAPLFPPPSQQFTLFALPLR